MNIAQASGQEDDLDEKQLVLSTLPMPSSYT